jgi:hypothetical protein
MEESKKVNKKALYVALSGLFCFIIPLLVLLFNFDFFKKDTTIRTRITCIGVFVLFVLIIKFNSWLNTTIKTLGNITLQKVLITLKGVVFCISAIVILELLKNSVSDLQVIIGVIGASFLVGNWFMLELKREIKQDEREQHNQDTTNAVYQAMKKMQEEQK